MRSGLRMGTALAQTQVLLWRFGWSWPLSALVLAGVAAVYIALLAPMRHELARTHAELAHASAGAGALPAQPAAAPEQEQLGALRASLNAPADAAELIRRLDRLARAERIALAQGEYRQQFHADTQLLQLQVTQPIKAGYSQLKRYMESVLRTMPYASLDQIAARRENVAQAQLEVRLQWSFWSHQPRSTGRGPGAEGSRP
jgi:hypothetical protein